MDKPTVTVRFTREEYPDHDPDISYLQQDYADVPDALERAQYVAQDAARLAAFRNGDWYMLGIRAKATIIIRRPGYSTHYELTSPGLWGIESDSDEGYLREIFADECKTLQEDIEAMGAAHIRMTLPVGEG